MTLVGAFAIILGLLQARFAFVHATSNRVAVFIFAYLLHVAMSVAYYILVSGGGGDSYMYFYDPLGYYSGQFTWGTIFLVYFTQAMKGAFGGTFLDFFLLFQTFGFVGIVALMRIFEETFESLGLQQPRDTYWLLFIPGIHYWSSGIGKDSLFFSAVCLSIWAAIRLKQRLPVLIFSVVLMAFIRPHIAAITLAALALTVISDRQTNVVLRVAFFIAAALGAAYSLATITASYQVNLASAEGISQQLSSREAIVESGEAGNTGVDAIYPLRVLSLLFRPMFIDANGALGLVVSVENAVLVLIALTLCRNWRTTWQMCKTVPFVRFALFSSIGTLLAVALTYYNIGLGIRQKATMILPGILVTYAVFRAVVMARTSEQEAAVGRPIVPPPASERTA